MHVHHHAHPSRARRSPRLVATGALAAALAFGTPAVGASAAPSPGVATVTSHAGQTERTSPGATKAQKKRAAQKAKAKRQKQRRMKRVRHHRAVVRAKVDRALKVARHQKGDPYRYGASGPGSFDCSGLVNYAYRKAGFKGAPRTSSSQAHWARRIPRGQMKPGDLVFFTDGGGVYHVGVFGGFRHGKRHIVHAPNSGERVKSAPIWTNSWFAGTMRAR